MKIEFVDTFSLCTAMPSGFVRKLGSKLENNVQQIKRKQPDYGSCILQLRVCPKCSPRY